MKRISLLFILSLTMVSLFAQESNKLKFKFSGFLRMDYYIDSRQSVAPNENLLFLYPTDKDLDQFGEDKNAIPNAGLYAFNARPMLEISGLEVLGAKVKGLLEADFAGYSNSTTMLRIRRAFMDMEWKNMNLLVGQEWHPFFDCLTTGQLSISAGAPYQPFNRSPQVRFNYKNKGFTGSIAAMYQFQFNSVGLGGKSNTYQHIAVVPEMVLMLDYKYKNLRFGVGMDYLTIRPRTTSIGAGDLDYDHNNPEDFNSYNTYRTDETISSLSYIAYLKYSHKMFSVSAKTTLGNNFTHTLMFGGFGISDTEYIGTDNYGYMKYSYSALTNSASWLNLSYGKKFLSNLMIGYTTNLGTKDDDSCFLFFGEGLKIKDMYGISYGFSYNIPHFRLGVEYQFTRANYGDGGLSSNGTYASSHGINNHRSLATISYIF